VTKDDVRENIINYCDEGGGENDMKTLKVPIGQLPELVQHKSVGASKYNFAVLEEKKLIQFFCLRTRHCCCIKQFNHQVRRYH
jgi:Cadherin cytoplasmic region